MTTLWYLDSSAIVKLVAREPETNALVEGLRDEPDVVSSVLAKVEVMRAVKRTSRKEVDRRRAEHVLARIALLRIDEIVIDKAATLDPSELRSLDAIHLASALSIADGLDALVTYDDRMARVAGRLGMTVLSPGNNRRGGEPR